MGSEDLPGLLIPVLFLGMPAIEATGTGRRWPEVRRWRLEGPGLSAVPMASNIVPPSRDASAALCGPARRGSAQPQENPT